MSGGVYEVLGHLRYSEAQTEEYGQRRYVPAAKSCPAHLKGTSVKIKSKEGEVFEVPAEAACIAGAIRTILVQGGSDDEIPLPLGKELVTKVIEYLKYHAENPSGEIKVPLEGSNLQECGATKWDAAFLKLDKDKLYDILLASSLLDIGSLFFSASVQAALTLKERGESNKLRKDFNMTNDLTADDEESLVALYNGAKKKKNLPIPEERQSEELGQSAAMMSGIATAAEKLGVLNHSGAAATVKSWKLANWRAAVMLDWTLLVSAPEEVRGDRDLICAALMASSGKAMKYATDELKQDKELVLMAVECSGAAFGEAATVLKGDKTFVQKAVDVKGEAMTGAADSLRSDSSFLLEVLGGPGEGSAVKGATDELKSDPDFILKAVEIDAEAYKFASKDLQKSADFAMKAAATNGLCLQFMNSIFQANHDIVAAAVKENPKAAMFAHSARRTELKMGQDYDQDRTLKQDDIEALGTVIQFVQASRIVNHFTPEEVWNPWFLKTTKLVTFTAGSTMSGNMGQGNYVAGNAFMDKLPGYERETHDSVGLMWGAVGAIGMRWKAFASADFLNATPDVLLGIDDCCKILHACCCWVGAPEWWNCQFYDGFTREAYLRPTAGFGSGGGWKPSEDALPLEPHPSSQRRGDQRRANGGKERNNAPLGGWPGLMNPLEKANEPPPFREGTRIKLVGMGSKDGKRGTILKEADGDRWKVWLDYGGGNVIVKPENMEVVVSVDPPTGDKATPARTHRVCTGSGLVVEPTECAAPLGPRTKEEQPEDFRGHGKKWEADFHKEQSDKAQAWWRAQLGGFDNVIDALSSVPKAEVLESPPAPKIEGPPKLQNCD